MSQQFSRRNFLAASGAGALLSGLAPAELVATNASVDGAPAILGGTPFTLGSSPGWPRPVGGEEGRLRDVIQRGVWMRTNRHTVAEFESMYAELTGAKRCITTSSGTTALINTLAALNVGPGDEVITSPYTFVATINSIHEHFALPTVADIDLETFQIDAAAADAACTENTTVLMPVHIGGHPANMDAFVEIGRRRNLPVVEDACQGHFGKWGDKFLGSVGTAGCFSFQESKNLPCGEGGAVITSDEALGDRIFAVHTHGIGANWQHGFIPARTRNNRMPEISAAILMAQSAVFERNADIRQENGTYLNQLLSEIPGVYPAKVYPGARSGWHLYMLRIAPEEFGINRDRFLPALRAENISGWWGYTYTAVDWAAYTKEVYATIPATRRVFSERYLDDWAERIGTLPNYKRLCNEAVWLSQNFLLGPRRNMEIIADAVRRIQRNASSIAALS